MSHQTRITKSIDAFQTAMEALIAALERLTDEAAARTPAGGGWSAAQIGWHVAATNELFAGALVGTVPFAQPVPEGFSENPDVFVGIPDKIQTPPQLEPIENVSRGEAVAKLRGSVPVFVSAAQALEEERASTHCVQLRFGVLSMHQFVEFAALHATRHLAQLERAAAAA